MAPTVTVLGVPETLAVLESVQWRALHLEPVLSGPVARTLGDFFEKRWASAGAYGGSPWAALSPAASLRGNALALMLFQTGRLWRSLVDTDSPDGIRTATDSSLEYGTSVPYAVFLHEGTKNMPARELIPEDGLPEEVTDQWESLVEQYIMEPNPVVL